MCECALFEICGDCAPSEEVYREQQKLNDEAQGMNIHELEYVLQESEERAARAEARIIELEGVIAGLRDKLDILVYPETAFKEYQAKCKKMFP